MTKEEAIRFLKRDHCWKGVPPDTQMAIETLMQQPSLPSDLDEAAEELANEHGFVKHPSCKPAKYSYQAVRDVFIEAAIAGAEWMAGQGQTFEAHVDNGCAIASGVKLPFVLWDTYEDGDVLKVQIRKKQ